MSRGRFREDDPRETKAWFESVLRGQGPIRWLSEWEGKCRCPLHEDKEPSFSFNVKKGVWNCHAGCGGGGIKALAERLGVPTPWGDGGKKELKSSPKSPSARETLYDYRDENDKLIYQIVRWDEPGKEKSVRQRRPDGKGGWLWNMKGVCPVPYRLPELLKSIAERKWIIVAEGEKGVDALVKHGFHATTNHGGAGKWSKELNRYFSTGVHVAVVYDNDKAGVKHRDMVGRALADCGCEVRSVDLGYPYTEKHAKDIYDWFAEGHTRDEFMALVKDSPVFTPIDVPDNDVPFPEEEEGAGRKSRKKAPLESSSYKSVGGYRMNDAGNAQRLIDAHGKNLHYCHKWKKWLTWDGRHWDEDAPYMLTQLCVSITERMYEDAEEIDDYREREDYLEFVCKSGNNSRITAMLNIAKDAQGVPVDPSQLDAGKFYLNCRNGTVDLRTGYMVPHARGDLITKILPINQLRPIRDLPYVGGISGSDHGWE